MDQVFLGELLQGDFLILDDSMLLQGHFGELLIQDLLGIILFRADLFPLPVPLEDDVRVVVFPPAYRFCPMP